jgi:hypothetical protein
MFSDPNRIWQLNIFELMAFAECFNARSDIAPIRAGPLVYISEHAVITANNSEADLRQGAGSVRAASIGGGSSDLNRMWR